MNTVSNQEQISFDFDLVYNAKSHFLWIILVPNIHDLHEKLRGIPSFYPMGHESGIWKKFQKLHMDPLSAYFALRAAVS